AITPRQRLRDRSVVVARLDALDVEPAIVRFHRPAAVEYDAGGHRGLALRVTDVEAFQALRYLFEVERRPQRLEARLEVHPVARRAPRLLGGIALRHVDPATRRAPQARTGEDRHL